MYALLERKTQAVYTELLAIVRAKCREVNQEPDPTTIVIDFELAMVRAVEMELGDHITVRCCFFHLTQSTWRKVQALGLSMLYRESEDVKLFCGMIDALALLPMRDMEAGLQFLRDHTPEGMQPLLQYFDETYCSGTVRVVERRGRAGGVRRIQPHFPPAMWNVHEATVNGEQRTNNLCEAWNCRMGHLCGSSHPNVWRLLH